METMNDNKQQIKSFVSQYMPDYQLRDDEDIFATGFVNSLFVMQLVLFIEKTFLITLASSDLDVANFRTVTAITNLVEQKLADATVLG